MFGETSMFHVKIWNHPIETNIYKWMFQVPGDTINRAVSKKQEVFSQTHIIIYDKFTYMNGL